MAEFGTAAIGVGVAAVYTAATGFVARHERFHSLQNPGNRNPAPHSGLRIGTRQGGVTEGDWQIYLAIRVE